MKPFKARVRDRLFARILRLAHRRSWGVEFVPENGAPEILITPHATERLKQRFPTLTEKKTKKVVWKAWNSKQTSRQLKKYKKYPQRFYRLFQGLIFIFERKNLKEMGFTQKILVTVILPGEVE